MANQFNFRRRLALSAVATLAPGGQALSQQAPKVFQARPLKIGFAYDGAINEDAWTKSHELARLALVQEFGERVSTEYFMNVPEGALAEPVFKSLIAGGCDLIFGTSFGHMDPMLKIAAKYPKVRFEHATGIKRANNLRTYNVRTYEAAYLAGILAASKTVTKSLGFVGSIPIPEVLQNLNAFALGAQSVVPEVKVFADWVNVWFDPELEAKVAETLISRGVDVIAQNTESSAVIQTAQRHGLHAIGMLSDWSRFGPEAHLGSMVPNWAPYYIESARQVLDGTWRSTDSWWGLAENSIDLVGLPSKLDASIKSAIMTTKEAIRSRQLDIWAGPIRRASGALEVPAGATINHKGLKAMYFLVSGISTSISHLRQ